MGILRAIIRTSAFLAKEIAEVLRQPRLILTLILGPFLILALFGIGYRNQARALRTMFVVPQGEEQGQLAQEIKQYATSLGPQLVFSGITSDRAAAENALLRRQVDVVVLTPPDPSQTIKNNQQAKFTLLHNEIDPTQADYVKYFGEVYVNEVNRRMLEGIAQNAQQQAAQNQQDVQQARANATAVREALQAGDHALAQQHQQNLNQNVGALELGLGTAAGLLAGVQQTANPGQAGDNLGTNLQGIRQETNSLGNNSGADTAAQIQKAQKLENDLARLDTELTDFRKMDPQVLVQPFVSDAMSLAPVQLSVTDYFAPSVIALLLQHVAVTFAALSIVREVRLGTMELFRVSPISAGETLLGKYLSYMVFGGIVAAVLSLLVIYGLHVPLLGDPRLYALVILALLFTSLGLGFIISLVSQTESQAVQYTMIVLLASVFFSGFMLNIDNLVQPVRAIAWILPATYGISLLQNLMLRGYDTQLWMLPLLAALGVLFYLVAWLQLRRRLARA